MNRNQFKANDACIQRSLLITLDHVPSSRAVRLLGPVTQQVRIRLLRREIVVVERLAGAAVVVRRCLKVPVLVTHLEVSAPLEIFGEAVRRVQQVVQIEG